jgi:hypothetical protein
VGGRSRASAFVGNGLDVGLRVDLAGGAAVMPALWSNAVGYADSKIPMKEKKVKADTVTIVK